MKAPPRLRLDLQAGMYQLLAEKCSLCRQTILPDRQLPFERIVKLRQGMCPSCRQTVSTKRQEETRYQRAWLLFVRDAGLRWKAGDRSLGDVR